VICSFVDVDVAWIFLLMTDFFNLPIFSELLYVQPVPTEVLAEQQ